MWSKLTIFSRNKEYFSCLNSYQIDIATFWWLARDAFIQLIICSFNLLCFQSFIEVSGKNSFTHYVPYYISGHAFGHLLWERDSHFQTDHSECSFRKQIKNGRKAFARHLKKSFLWISPLTWIDGSDISVVCDAQCHAAWSWLKTKTFTKYNITLIRHHITNFGLLTRLRSHFTYNL